jgi:hypothetical protein
MKEGRKHFAIPGPLIIQIKYRDVLEVSVGQKREDSLSSTAWLSLASNHCLQLLSTQKIGQIYTAIDPDGVFRYVKGSQYLQQVYDSTLGQTRASWKGRCRRLV